MSDLKTNLEQILQEKQTKIIPENIKKNVEIFGITGTLEAEINTSDATATADDILNPKTAYIAGGKVTGNIIPEYQYQDVKLNVLSNLILNTSILDINDEYKLAVCGGKGTTNSVTIRNITSDNNLGDIVLTISNSEYGGGNFRAAAISKQLNKNKNLNVWTACGDNNGIVKVFEINPINYNLESTTTFNYNGWIFRSEAFRICMAVNPVNPNLIAFAHQPGAGNSEGNIAVSIMQFDENNKNIIKKYSTNYDKYGWLQGNPFETEWDSTGRYVIGCFGKIASNHGFIFDTLNGKQILTFNNTGNVCMINDQYWLQNGILKTYTNENVNTFDELTDNSYKWYNNGFIFKVINNTLTAYYIDFTAMSLTKMSTLPLNSAVSSSEGIRRPLSNEFLYFMDNTTGYKFIPVIGEQEIVSLKRKGYVYTYLDTSVTTPSECVLEGNKFYNNSGIKNGSMPDNGVLNFEQLNIDQTIPLGYTSGGVVPAYPQTSEDYISCLMACNNILTGKDVTQISYIESSGTQYIDTGVIPTNDTIVEMSMKKVGNIIDYERFFGTDYAICLMRRNRANYELRVNNSGNNPFDISSENFDIVKFGKGQVSINDSVVDTYTNVFTTNETAYIFYSHSADRYGIMQLAYCKIWEGDELVRSFIPAKDFDNIICLYDEVEKKFYYNKGTGNFIGGEN